MNNFINNHIRSIRLDVNKETDTNKSKAISKANNKKVNYLKLIILGIEELKDEQGNIVSYNEDQVKEAISEIHKAPPKITKDMFEYINKHKPILADLLKSRL